jgi:alpha-1,2-mannosyltransferase
VTAARPPAAQAVTVAMTFAVVAAVCAAYLAFTLVNASYTLGCDYLTYDTAVRAWLAGGTPYDLGVTTVGQCGLYQYPPVFLLLVTPFTVLSPAAATWAWIAVLVACLGAAILVMPVPLPVRLITLALAGTSWPMLFAIKVGAIGPILLLLFAAGWRWLDRPVRLAATVVAGAFAKVMPGLLLPWMMLVGRWRAAGLTALGLAAIGIASLLLQSSAWLDFLTVERVISGAALEAPANLTPGSFAFSHGVPAGVASLVNLIHAAGVLVVVVVAARRATIEASFIVAAVASQVVAPVLWDHYAVVLFLPVAYLLARRQWWILLPAVAVNATLVAVFPAVLYVVILDVALVGVAITGWRERRSAPVVAAA